MHFQDATLKSLALKAGYATQEAKFELYMQSIKEAEIHALRKKLTIKWQKSKPDSYAIHISNERGSRHVDPAT